ncbi:MAG: hypothetical protein AAGF31_07860 [Planctomycetota bacterium]
MSRPSTPKWVTLSALAAFLIGLATIVLGPMMLYALASGRASANLPAEQQFDEQAKQDALVAELEIARKQFLWVFPVGCGVGFCGMIALLLIWVSRPLGSDTDEPPPAADAGV